MWHLRRRLRGQARAQLSGERHRIGRPANSRHAESRSYIVCGMVCPWLWYKLCDRTRSWHRCDVLYTRARRFIGSIRFGCSTRSVALTTMTACMANSIVRQYTFAAATRCDSTQVAGFFSFVPSDSRSNCLIDTWHSTVDSLLLNGAPFNTTAAIVNACGCFSSSEQTIKITASTGVNLPKMVGPAAIDDCWRVTKIAESTHLGQVAKSQAASYDEASWKPPRARLETWNQTSYDAAFRVRRIILVSME